MGIALFHKIDDAVAIVRLKGGVHKQVDMYRRGERVYIPQSGGFIRVTASFGGVYGTTNPNTSVLEFDAPGVIAEGNKEPRFERAWGQE